MIGKFTEGEASLEKSKMVISLRGIVPLQYCDGKEIPVKVEAEIILGDEKATVASLDTVKQKALGVVIEEARNKTPHELEHRFAEGGHFILRGSPPFFLDKESIKIKKV